MSMDPSTRKWWKMLAKICMATNLYHAKIHIQNMTKHIIHPAWSILSQHMSAQLFCTGTAQKHHCICYSISPSHPTSQYNGTVHTYDPWSNSHQSQHQEVECSCINGRWHIEDNILHMVESGMHGRKYMSHTYIPSNWRHGDVGNRSNEGGITLWLDDNGQLSIEKYLCWCWDSK